MKHLLECLDKGFLESKKQQDHVFKHLNNDGEYSEHLKDILHENEISLSAEQQKQGLDWLVNLWITPTGKERKSNPFGYREIDVLQNFDKATLCGYYDNAGYGRTYYIPVYCVYGAGTSFDYIMSGGEIKIIG